MLKVILAISIIANVFTAVTLVSYSKKHGGVIAVFEKVLFKQPKNDSSVSHLYDGRVDLLKKIPGNTAQIIMLGDSLTDGGEWQEFFSDVRVVNRGIGRDTSKGVLNRIEPYLVSQPDKIFLLIGTNDLLNNSQVSDVSSNITEILNLIRGKSPKTTVYLQSVLPCRNDLVAKEKILQINEFLKKKSDQNKIIFIDLHRQFVDQNGMQIKPLFLSDGIHLSALGYMKWVEILKQNHLK